MAEKQKKKNVTEYEQLKEQRGKDLLQDYKQFISHLRQAAASKAVEYCQKYANRNGEYDQIDEQVCLRDRVQVIQSKITKVLPQMSQHSRSYEQCMAECQRNTISYIVANQSCRGVYEKNFKLASERIAKRLKSDQII